MSSPCFVQRKAVEKKKKEEKSWGKEDQMSRARFVSYLTINYEERGDQRGDKQRRVKSTNSGSGDVDVDVDGGELGKNRATSMHIRLL